MFQGTVPRFHPSEENHGIALGVLEVLRQRLEAIGVTEPADVALVRGVMSGLAAEQIADDPQARLFVDQTARAIGAVLAAIAEVRSPQVSGRRGRV